MFKKGKSGNPSGRKIDNVDGYNLPQLCRIESRDSVKKVASIANDPDIKPEARLKAFQMLWDRGFGKSPQLNVAPTDLKTALELTDNELASIAATGGSGVVESTSSPQTTH